MALVAVYPVRADEISPPMAPTLTVSDPPPPPIVENFVDLVIETPVATPSAWSMFWKKELQNMILLATLDPIDDATKRVKYAEENMQLPRFVIGEASDADHVAIAISAIKRGEDLIKGLNSRKQRYLLNGNQDSWKLAKNIMVFLNHSDSVLTEMITIIGRENLLAEGAIGDDFQVAFGSLHGTTTLFIQQQTRVEREVANRSRGSGIFKNDQDRDGLLDAVEMEMGLSITDPDTDGDGLDEKKEIEIYCTDPTKFDTDGDGFRDGMEIINAYNPLGAGKIEISSGEQGFTVMAQVESSPRECLNKFRTNNRLTTTTLNYLDRIELNTERRIAVREVVNELRTTSQLTTTTQACLDQPSPYSLTATSQSVAAIRNCFDQTFLSRSGTGSRLDRIDSNYGGRIAVREVVNELRTTGRLTSTIQNRLDRIESNYQRGTPSSEILTELRTDSQLSTGTLDYLDRIDLNFQIR